MIQTLPSVFAQPFSPAKTVVFGNGAAFPITTQKASQPDTAEISGIPVLKSQEEFKAVIENSKVPVLVKFEKKQCPACEALEPVVAGVAKGNAESLKVVKVLMWDPENPGNRSLKKLAWEYKLKTVPVFMVFENGKLTQRGDGEAGLLQILQDRKIQYSLPDKELPPPYQPPDAALTVLFDGKCPVCLKMSAWIKSVDKNNRIALVPLQSEIVKEKYSDLDPKELHASIHIVRSSDGKVFKGAEAFREMGTVIKAHNTLGYMLKTLKVASKVPGVLPVVDKIYLAFSKRRFMFAAKQANCKDCTLE